MKKAIRKFSIEREKSACGPKRQRLPPELHALLRRAIRLKRRDRLKQGISLLHKYRQGIEKRYGARDCRRAYIYNRIGLWYLKSYRIRQAKRWLSRSEAIYRRLKVLPLLWSAVLNNLGLTYRLMGRYHKASQLLQEMLRLRLAHYGPNHRNMTWSYNSIGLSKLYIGDYREALQLFRRAYTIQVRHTGSMNRYAGTFLHNMALAAYSLGDYAKATMWMKQALENGRHNYGRTHRRVGRRLSLLGKMYVNQREFKIAMSFFTKALVITKQRFGASHLNVARVMHSIASAHFYAGHIDAAKKMWRRTFQCCTKTLPKRSIFRLVLMRSLARLYLYQKRWKAALTILLQMQAVMGQTFARTHALRTGLYEDLARAFLALRQLAKANALSRKGLRLLRSKFGPSHPSVASLLSILGRGLRFAGKEKEAVLCLQEAIALWKRWPSMYPVVEGGPLFDLALLQMKHGKHQKALLLLTTLWKIQKRWLRRSFAISSWDEKAEALRFVTKSNHAFFTALSKLQKQSKRDQALPFVRAGWARALQTKSLLWQVRLAEGEVLRQSPELRTLLLRLRHLQRLVVKWRWRRPRTQKALQAWELRWLRLQSQMKKVERKLSATRIAGGRVRFQRLPVPARFQRHLQEREALLDIVRYALVEPRVHQITPQQPAEMRYLAFILRKRGRVHLVDLGRASRIDRAIHRWRRIVQHIPPRYLGGVKRGFLRLAKPNRILVQRLWKPLRRLLHGIETLSVVGDGALHLWPWGGLRLPSGRFLVEGMQVRYLNQGLDLLQAPRSTGPRTKPTSRPALYVKKNALVFGAPSFGRNAKGVQHPYRPLHGSLREVQEIAARLRVRPLVGTQARKSSLLAMLAKKTPHLLHLSTHVFLAAKPAGLSTPRERPRSSAQSGGSRHRNTHGQDVLWSDITRGKTQRGTQGVFSPLLQTGLVFAGANREPEQGVLTAQEIAGLDLRNTHLVVLSACHTGTGVLRPWQGVVGLRSAFWFAGSRRLVLSLWPVPDRITAHWMSRFYRHLLHSTSPAQALRQTQLSLIQELRQTQGVAHPLFWGGMVYLGLDHQQEVPQ